MKHTFLKACLLIAAMSLAVSMFGASSSVDERMPRAPHYRPPDPSAPKVRVDGRARGTDDAILTLTVLAPEHVGLTTKEQPSLYWYQSRAARTRFEVTIMEPKAIVPVLETKFEPAGSEGVVRVNLADHNVKLKPGVEYRWTVAMVPDPDNRSKDVVASGVIKRIAPPDSLTKRLTDAPETELPFIYADEGFWYDSLEALSNLIDKQPADKGLHEVRAVYFMQVGLSEAARHEMKLASAGSH